VAITDVIMTILERSYNGSANNIGDDQYFLQVKGNVGFGELI